MRKAVWWMWATLLPVRPINTALHSSIGLWDTHLHHNFEYLRDYVNFIGLKVSSCGFVGLHWSAFIIPDWSKSKFEQFYRNREGSNSRLYQEWEKHEKTILKIKNKLNKNSFGCLCSSFGCTLCFSRLQSESQRSPLFSRCPSCHGSFFHNW